MILIKKTFIQSFLYIDFTLKKYFYNKLKYTITFKKKWEYKKTYIYTKLLIFERKY